MRQTVEVLSVDTRVWEHRDGRHHRQLAVHVLGE